MKILFISTEAEPFAKSGGLGDVVGSLPKELIRLGAEVRVILPLYKSVREQYSGSMKFLCSYTTLLGWRNQYCGIFELEYEGVTFYFIDNEQYFNRDGYYGYYDDGERFAYFSKAAVDAVSVLDFELDILHCSEWQTALVPVYVRTIYSGRPEYDRLKLVFTIHNIEYQGRYGHELLNDLLGLPDSALSILDYEKDINFMKGAIVTCDKLTTVSPTYAEELSYPFYSRGLGDIISQHKDKFVGILNGIDVQKFHPYFDRAITARYSRKAPGKKALNKSALQERLGLIVDDGIPLIAMVTRLTEHKGIDLVMRVFDELMEEEVQFVILGTGDKKYQEFFTEKARQYAGRVAAVMSFSGDLANQIYAGCDLFLMPSICEPCGLSQMISLRYGTVPVVRETGGLADSIHAYNEETGEGNGVTFGSVNAHDMLGAVRRGLKYYRQPQHWKKLMDNGFASDCSWRQSAKEYIRIYDELLGGTEEVQGE